MTHPAFEHGHGAVVTGAALGIGRALAQFCAGQGMRVALLDTDAAHLSETAAKCGPDALAIPCDVSDMAAVEAARDRILRHWGQPPSLLVNNAVTRIGRGFDAPLEDWQRAVQINLFGVIHGVRAFLPEMLKAGCPGAVVNVGSKQGITNPPGHPVYNLCKAAVKSYTEGLAHDLRQRPGCAVTAHLLIPGWTTTGLNDHKTGAWMPDRVVDYLVAAMDKGSFYILCPDDEVTEDMDRERILWAAEDITQNRPALSRWHQDWAPRFDAWRRDR